MTYETDIHTDETAIDVEWLDQPQRMRKYCRLAAEANREMDLAKERLEFIRAQLDRNIRADPKAFGVEPGSRGVTEDAIKAAVQVHGDYQAAVRAHIDAKFEYEVAKGTVKAFDQRKDQLENLVRLHGLQYFAGPSVPRDLPTMRAAREREIQAKIRIGGSKRRDDVLGGPGGGIGSTGRR